MEKDKEKKQKDKKQKDKEAEKAKAKDKSKDKKKDKASSSAAESAPTESTVTQNSSTKKYTIVIFDGNSMHRWDEIFGARTLKDGSKLRIVQCSWMDTEVVVYGEQSGTLLKHTGR